MNASPMENNHLIERYLRNQLEEEERNEFEIQLLDDTELLEEVQRREAFISGLISINEETNNTSDKITSNVVPLNPRQWIRQPLSMAASILVVAGALIIAQTTIGVRPAELPASDLSAIETSITLETLRGDRASINSSGVSPILLTIGVGPDITGSFSVSIINEADDQVIVSLPNLAPDVQGWLRVVVNRDLDGDFRVDINSNEGTANMSYLLRFND